MASTALRRVLLLGSGYIAGPLVESLTRDGTVAVTVASRNLAAAQKLASFTKNTTTSALTNITEEGSLDTLIPGHDLVISYVHPAFHPLIAKQCINHKVNLITTDYVTPELQELHQPACDAGVVLMNEMGLDPGIDHMLAMKCIDEVHAQGGKISSFVSYCGGQPAPECSDNPLRYKFSWYPKGSLMAACRGGRIFRDGKIVDYKEGGDLMEQAEPICLYPDIDLIGFPNRDSIKYQEIYGIQEAHTCIRGTLRYMGFHNVALALIRLGVLSDVSHPRLQPGAPSLTWKEWLSSLLAPSEVTEVNIRSAVNECLGKDDSMLKAVEELRLLSDDAVELCGTPLNALSSHLKTLLQFQPGERDVVFLHHTIGIEWPNKKEIAGYNEECHIDLTLYGTPHGFTAMAQTVGRPTAIAAHMILTGEICKRGVVIPTTSDIYDPILERLKKEGIQASKYMKKEYMKKEGILYRV